MKNTLHDGRTSQSRRRRFNPHQTVTISNLSQMSDTCHLKVMLKIFSNFPSRRFSDERVQSNDLPTRVTQVSR